MSFRNSFENIEKIIKEAPEVIIEAESTSNIDKIKKSNIKIKLIVPTKFGEEVIFFRASDAEDAAKLVGTKKIDGNSIFIDKKD